VSNGVVIADWVHNTTDDTWAQVTAVAAGDLTLDGDIFISGENYEDVGFFKPDGNGHSMDLSGIVPKNAKGVLFRGTIYSTSAGDYVAFGMTSDRGGEYLYSIANAWVSGVFTLPLDSTRTIHFGSNDNVLGGILFLIIGWWL